MLIELYIFAFAIIAYGIIITLAIIGFHKLRLVNPIAPLHETPTSFISIVVSSRNESLHIEEFLYEIIKQNFSRTHFEFILVDDFSSDHTLQKATNILENSNISYKILKQKEHQGKKKSIAWAIKEAKGDIIVTTDADVVYRHQNWLLTISNYFNLHQPNLLIMPIDFKSHSGALSAFQITENLALTGMTAGFAGVKKGFMCNGANLAFTKKAYEQVSGYTSHIHISSGEDVFILEDIKKLNPNGIHYYFSRDLIVKTNPTLTLSSFINQRVRWASKAKSNKNQLNLLIGFITILTNLIFLALLVALVKNSIIWPYLLIFALAKFVFDFLLLFLASDFLGRLKYIWWLIPFESIYWLYALTIGVLSMFYKPYWKEQKTN